MDMANARPSSSPFRISDRVKINGTVIPLTLTFDGYLRWRSSRGQRCLSLDKEVLGFTVEHSKIRIKAVGVTNNQICCVGTKSSKGITRKDFVLEPLHNESLRLWCQHLHDCLDSLGRPKSLFVFINPFGGKKSASKIFFDDVKPLLEDADVEITLQETKHQLHAKDVARSLDITKYDGIVCVSGDGVLVEVVNGLLEREDWRDAIKMPLGMVPAGTGNGMVKSLMDSVSEPCNAANVVLAIIRGHKQTLDVATIMQGGTRFFSVLMLAWGLVADIDIESEKYHWMGSARLDFYALKRVFHLRIYTGRISFVPAPGFESFGEPTSYNGESNERQNSGEEKSATIRQSSYQGPEVNLKNMDWRMIDGPFVSIWLHNVPWGSENTMAAPDAKFSDGYLDLILMKECPKLSLLALMSEMNSGNHVKSPHVLYLKVKAIILEPGPRADDPSVGGIIDVDGEVLAKGNGTYKCDQKALMCYDKLEIRVDQGLATLFSPVV